jgi:hypothetical protein
LLRLWSVSSELEDGQLLRLLLSGAGGSSSGGHCVNVSNFFLYYAAEGQQERRQDVILAQEADDIRICLISFRRDASLLCFGNFRTFNSVING